MFSFTVTRTAVCLIQPCSQSLFYLLLANERIRLLFLYRFLSNVDDHLSFRHGIADPVHYDQLGTPHDGYACRFPDRDPAQYGQYLLQYAVVGRYQEAAYQIFIFL